jgi:peptidoglycan glycosyltransferase
MNDISKSIKKVLFVFLLCFVVLISYITYFEINTSTKIVSNPLNKRLWAKRNEVLRGTIYDKNMQPLTKSEKINELSQKREYTGGAIFAHVLGYVDEKYGITGLERKYDSDLMAEDVSIKNIFSMDDKKEEKVGHDLITTLDMNLQKKAYELLGNQVGSVVALNPQTGAILAMVSTPSFDPNDLKNTWKDINANEKRPLLNRAVSGLYPPGSTFKTVTALSALENISDIKTKTYEDNGKLVFNSKESLGNFEGETLGNLSFMNAYIHSSNVVFGGLGLTLGNSKLLATAEKFYFNKNIPSDGIVIDNSIFPTYKSYEKGNIAQSAIGQSGVLASPMQMALVASTIANGGVMMEPYLVDKVENSKGTVLNSFTPKAISTVASKENAKYIKDMMRGVVTSGTGSGINFPGLNICGKTGTAENSAKGKEQEAHSWFIAFAPYENPKIAVAVIVENGGQGAGAAGNIAGQLIKTYSNK